MQVQCRWSSDSACLSGEHLLLHPTNRSTSQSVISLKHLKYLHATSCSARSPHGHHTLSSTTVLKMTSGVSLISIGKLANQITIFYEQAVIHISNIIAPRDPIRIYLWRTLLWGLLKLSTYVSIRFTSTVITCMKEKRKETQKSLHWFSPHRYSMSPVRFGCNPSNPSHRSCWDTLWSCKHILFVSRRQRKSILNFNNLGRSVRIFLRWTRTFEKRPQFSSLLL